MIKGNILIVEDEGILALGLKKKLEKLGYMVLATAASGEEAVELVAKHIPDLILMDIILMGTIDGIDTSKKIQSIYDIPIVYLTAFSDDETLRRALGTEPYGYLLKPYNERELEIVVELALYKKKTKQLKESSHWLETILRSIGDAVIAIDQEGSLTFINSAAERLMGKSSGEVIGQNLEDVFKIIDEVSRTSAMSISNRNVNATITPIRNSLLVASGGKTIPVEFLASDIADNQGNMMGTVLILKDLTLQRTMEAESTMRESVMASSINPLCITDLQGRIKYVNELVDKLWGYTREEITNRPVSEFFQIEWALKEIKDSLGAEGIWIGEAVARKKDGTSLFVKIEAKTINDRFGGSIGVLYSFVDITELKKAREELEKYVAKLHKIDLENDKIIANLADKVGIAQEIVDKIYAFHSEKRTAITNGELMVLLEDIKNSIDQIAIIQNQLIDSNLPQSLYIYLAELYRLKIEGFHNQNDGMNDTIDLSKKVDD